MWVNTPAAAGCTCRASGGPTPASIPTPGWPACCAPWWHWRHAPTGPAAPPLPATRYRVEAVIGKLPDPAALPDPARANRPPADRSAARSRPRQSLLQRLEGVIALFERLERLERRHRGRWAMD